METDVSGNKTSISTLNSQVSTINSTLPNKANLANPSFSNNISVAGTATLNEVALNSTLYVNGETVSPAQLGYLSHLAGDINDRFNSNETNISSHTTSINTINSTLPTKADDNAVVKLSGNQSVAGVKTFTSSPIVPDISFNDTNGQKVINKAYCDAKIADLVASAPSTLDTLNELAAALGNDASFSTTITNALALKATIASPTFTGTPSAPTASQGNNSTQIATTAYVDTGLALKAPLISPAITGTATFENIVVSGNGSIQGQLNGTGDSVIGDTSVDTLTVNSTSTFNAPITIASGQSLTTPTITLGGTDLQTRLNAKLNASNPTFTGTLTGQSIVDNGALSASGNVVLNTDASNTLIVNGVSTFNQNVTLATAKTLSAPAITLGGTDLQTTLNSKASTANPTFSGTFTTDNLVVTASSTTAGNCTLNGNTNIGNSNSDTLTVTATSTFNGNVLIGNSKSLTVTGGSVSFPSASVSSAAINNTSFVDLTTAQSIAGNKVFSGKSTLSGAVEAIQAGSVSSNAISLSYTSLTGHLISITPSSAANIALTLTNMPSTANQYVSVTLSFIINTASNKQYINSVSINGSSYTPISSGGFSNLAVNASAAYVLQTLTVLYINSATPTKVLTNIISLY